MTFLSYKRGRNAVLQRLFRTLNIKRRHEWEMSFGCIKSLAQGCSMDVVIFANKPREIQQSGIDAARSSLLIFDTNGPSYSYRYDQLEDLNLRVLYYFMHCKKKSAVHF